MWHRTLRSISRGALGFIKDPLLCIALLVAAMLFGIYSTILIRG